MLRALTEEAHAEQLTREETTASVHYVRWELTPEQVDRFEQGPVTLLSDHAAYQEETELSPTNTAELLADLRG